MKGPCPFYYGMNRRPALKHARRLGCIVEHVSGTGDIRVKFPGEPRPETFDGHSRKDAPRILVCRLIHLWRKLEDSKTTSGRVIYG
jgi:hypothetical protein